MDAFDRVLQQLEQDPELQGIKARMLEVETVIKATVSDENWGKFLEWEALWAEYLTLYAERLFPVAYRAGREANGLPDLPH
jgi:hypothetical protein